MCLALELLATLIAGRQALSLHRDGTIVVGDAAGWRELTFTWMRRRRMLVLVKAFGSEFRAELAGLMAGGLLWGLVAFCGGLAPSRRITGASLLHISSAVSSYKSILLKNVV
jgi:hypothetical protein